MLSERDVLAAMPPSADPTIPVVLTESAPDASASITDPAFLAKAQRVAGRTRASRGGRQ